MSRPARLQKALTARERKPSQQFGQPAGGTRRTRGGAIGCTDTVLQWLAWLWLAKWYTQDQVRALSGCPAGVNRGLRPTEVQRFCDRSGLPYVVRTGVTAADVLTFTRRGPVGIGHSYSYWPERQGFIYRGRRADGRPNGYAKPARTAGRTQLSGFVPPNDAHFGLVLGRNAASGNVFAWEPNHGSAARPEKPAFDYMTDRQFARVFDSYRTVLGRSTYALIPTRSLPL
jgi:hypothetical protein